MPKAGTRKADVAIVGGGPAGLMAAIHAARSGARVVLIEKLDQPGVKLLSTGGGRCNLTNTDTHVEFVSHFGKRGRFTRHALGRLDPNALCEFLNQLGVATHAPEGHGVYPASGGARAVRDALVRQCRSLGVNMLCGTPVDELALDEGTLVGVRSGSSTVHASRVVVACGGAAHPEMGSTGDGYGLAQSVGHHLVEPVPALVPIGIAEPIFADCAGVSLDRVELWLAGVANEKESSMGSLLFTHRGISGPAALDLSGAVARFAARGNDVKLRLDVSPGVTAQEWSRRMDEWRRSDGATTLRRLLSRHVPAKVAIAVVTNACDAPDVTASRLSRAQRQGVASAMSALELTATGTEGFAKAMVTSGGVQLDEVEARTLESRLAHGLYFAGEVLDLDGPCGGYNLQWAFSSGALAGEAAATSARARG